ncbi:LexA family transcriptional regulator [Sutterella sp.]|uniref:LexA family transcriptional regulator n=1 Tax=Sutterella sp. TaxID=1981025 RepID=UPI0026DFDD40|nr:LexA family transcriptional regulator [Sutterella sp.]MDO5532677.1 LexA family transcriptional regulator [Sutterella sp.]
MEFPERLSILLKNSGMSMRELARRVGVAHPSITKWIKGESWPSHENMEKLADCLGVTSAYLRYGDEGLMQARDSIVMNDGSIVSIPVMDCDTPGSARVLLIRVTRDWLLVNGILPESWESLRILIAPDDSMEPGVLKGAPVLVDTSVKVALDDGFYAVAYSQRVVIKRVQMQPDGSLRLLSDNPHYPPVVRADGLPLVLGKCLISLNINKLS